MIVMPESGPCCAMVGDPFAIPRPVNSVEPGQLATELRQDEPTGAVGGDVVRCSRRRSAAILWLPPSGKLMNHRSQDGDDEADQRRSAALIGLIIILALAIAGVWLVRELREKSQLEDCLMSGRTNCAPIEAPSRR